MTTSPFLINCSSSAEATLNEKEEKEALKIIQIKTHLN